MNNFIPDFLEVLTTEGWMELTQYKKRNPIMVLNKNLDHSYIIPKVLSSYDYKGPLLEIETETCTTFLKPSSKILVNGETKSAKDLRKNESLSRYHLGHKIESIQAGQWEGKLLSFFFGEELYLPIKFEKDYCLLVV